MKSQTLARMFCACLVVTLAAGSARAAFSKNIVVVRLGDGSAAVNDTAQQVYLDEYSLDTGALVMSHPLPASGAGAFTLSGRGEHDGHLNLSGNGQYLTLGGYRADAGASNPVLESSATVNRVIARVDMNWSADTSTALSDAYERTDITGVVSDDGQRFWTVGDGKYVDLVNGDVDYDFKVPTTSGGLRYVNQVGATGSVNLSQTQTVPTDLANDAWPDSIRSARIVDDQLYINTPAWESFGNRGAYATSDPLPKAAVDTPTTMIEVITNMEGQGADPKGKLYPKSDVIFLDLDATVPGVDTAYSTGGKADYEKWSLVNDEWVKLTDAVLDDDNQEINAFDVILEGDLVTLFAATDQGVYKLTDDTGYNQPLTSFFSAPFFLAEFQTEFRGIAIIPEPASIVMLALCGAGIALRRRRN
ncbi:MAG: PEP-CTERM sorting domain-containing protein [Phycisphaerales bacterium]|nr:PEP-CTERM sorting domain-containing protein [Phycisphaerales bacterium]